MFSDFSSFYPWGPQTIGALGGPGWYGDPGRYLGFPDISLGGPGGAPRDTPGEPGVSREIPWVPRGHPGDCGPSARNLSWGPRVTYGVPGSLGDPGDPRTSQWGLRPHWGIRDIPDTLGVPGSLGGPRVDGDLGVPGSPLGSPENPLGSPGDPGC